jgi:hypothetical protein
MTYHKPLLADGKMSGITSLSPAVIQSICRSSLTKHQTSNVSKNDSWAAVSFDTSQAIPQEALQERNSG